MQPLRPLLLTQLTLSYFLGYLLPVADAGLLLPGFIVNICTKTAKNDRALVVFSALFFIAGSVRGVLSGVNLPGGQYLSGGETVRFLGVVSEVKQEGPLVCLVVREARLEPVYENRELLFIPKIMVQTFGDSGWYECRKGSRVLGLGRVKKHSLSGSGSIYAARALVSGFPFKIDPVRGGMIFFGEKRRRGTRAVLVSKIYDGLRDAKRYEMGQDFLLSILTGKRGYHSTCRKVLVDSGLAHLQAISGLHVGVGFFFFGFASRLLFLVINRLGFIFDMNGPSLVLAALGTLAYAFLAGMPVTVSRAYSMMIFSALTVRKYDDRFVFTPLAFAFFLVIISEPAEAITASFVFSFLLTFYLLLLLGALLPRSAGGAKTGLCISITAYCASVPLAAYFFKRVALFGFIYNVIFVPLFVPLIGLALVWALLCILSFPLATLGGGALAMLFDILLRAVKWLCRFTGPATPVKVPGLPHLLLYFAAFTFILLLTLKTGKNADRIIEAGAEGSEKNRGKTRLFKKNQSDKLSN
ncbi:MAG: hypothetical protein GTN70_02065 [Deltaproteobacteria bacterium]|nr:hypothetical protein [Deltaproteobacteria bacterium]NIS76433.1 hypothetical protein [Deltaproteobacteria bacterium]